MRLLPWKTLLSTAACALALPFGVLQAQTWDWHVNIGFAGHTGMPVAFEPDGTMWISAMSYDGKTWRDYTPANTYGGLLGDRIRAVGIDRSGAKWFGYVGALSRFDGQRWSIYTTQSTGGGLVGGSINDIATDSRGNLWVAASSSGHRDAGLSKFDGKTWVKYTEANTGGEFGCSLNCEMVIDAQDQVWTSAGDNVYRFDGRNWTVFNAGNTGGALRGGAHSIALDKRGKVWVGGFGQIASFDGTRWRAYSPFADPFGSDRSKTGIFDRLGIDATGTVWAGSSPYQPGSISGLYRFNGADWRHYPREVSSMVRDPQDRLLFVGEDLSEFDGAFRVRHNAQTANSGLPLWDAGSIFIDAQGTTWTGHRGVIGWLKGKQWSRFTPANTDLALQVDDDVTAIAGDGKETRWFAVTDSSDKTSALLMKNGNQWRRYTARDFGFPLGRVDDLVVDGQQRLWAATNRGVVRFDGSAWTLFTRANTQGGLASDRVRSVALDRAGKPWFGSSSVELMSGTEGGVSTFDGQAWTTYTYANTRGGIPTNNVNRLRFDASGNLWAAVEASAELRKVGGLVSFDGKQWQGYPEQVKGGPLPGGGFYALAADAKSGVWIGTANGVIHFNGKEARTLNRENTRNALTDDRVIALAVDRQGSVWISSNGAGLAVYKPGVKESNSTATVVPQREPPTTPVFEDLPETKAAAAAEVAAAAAKKRAWEESSLDDLVDVFCMRFNNINPNFTGSRIKEMEATRFPVEEFFRKSRCQPGGYSNVVKSPILHLILDDAAGQEKTLQSVWLYYSRKRQQPALFGEMLNVRNTKGETFLDYMETMRVRGLLDDGEAPKRILQFACEHGAVYAAHKLQCPTR